MSDPNRLVNTRIRTTAARAASSHARSASLVSVPAGQGTVRRDDATVSRTFVRVGLGGGYALHAVAQCLLLWEVNRLNPAAPHGPAEAGIAAYLFFAVGVVLFVGALDFHGTAIVAGPAFRLLAIAVGLLAAGELATAVADAQHDVPTILVLAVVLTAAGDAAVACGWWLWHRAGSQRSQRRTKAATKPDWPIARRVTQVALASAYALYALADFVSLVTHGHAGAIRAGGLVIHAGGYGLSAVGHWQLVAALAWIAVARAARSGLVLLGLGGCVLAIVPYLGGTVPAATSIQAVASLALGIGWLVWASAGRINADEVMDAAGT
jgi:hypothetical protein